MNPIENIGGLGSVLQGDCLEVLATLPDNSVDLIVTDPPYFKVKKDWWDRQWDKPTEFLKWLDRIAEHWQRILKPNGSLYCFASPKMAARVEVMLGDRFNVLASITWDKQPEPGNDGWKQKAKKESLKNYWQQSERIIFVEHQNVGGFLKTAREKAGYTTTELCGLVGAYAVHNHGGAIRNWEYGLNTPSFEQYTELRKYLEIPHYEEAFRFFAVSEEVEYLDVWTFPTVAPYPGKHPCEKPLSLLSHIISASSRPGAVVLDCFAGSGATLVAAKQLDRRFIGIEIDPHWANVTRQRLGQFERSLTLEERMQWLETQVKVNTRKIKAIEDKTDQLTLFSA